MDLNNLSEEELTELEELLLERDHDQTYHRMNNFAPYGWQSEFITASKTNRQLLACTGNRCGKTFTGGHIMAYHLTGIYPDWWDGHRFDKPIQAWASGVSTITTRDILQAELLGDPKNMPSSLGTGAIPKEYIVNTINKIGTPNAFESIVVKHISGGNSVVTFKSYEMGQDMFMGTAQDLIWLDEECPNDIFTQCITRTATTDGIVYMTFTPEHGLTELVDNFMHNLKSGQFFIQASWDDAPHLNEETKEQLLSVYTEAERKMRSQGIPSLGSGVCYPVTDESITVAPFPIPSHWKKIVAVDLGFDHPNACVAIALDPDTGTRYLYDERSESSESLIVHAAGIKAMKGDVLPVVFPHDAFKRDGANTGKQFIDLYSQQGVNALPQPFSNPSPDGKFNNSVEIGVWQMLKWMETGKFKVFSTCTKFFREKAAYHRKDGKIVDRKDDILSATRYAAMSVELYGVADIQQGRSGYHLSDYEDNSPSWFGNII